MGCKVKGGNGLIRMLINEAVKQERVNAPVDAAGAIQNGVVVSLFILIGFPGIFGIAPIGVAG